MSIPEGYIEHDGGPAPVEPDEYVDCIIRTGEVADGYYLFGHSGVCQARDHVWEWALHPDGVGAVVASRSADRSESIDVRERWPGDAAPEGDGE